MKNFMPYIFMVLFLAFLAGAVIYMSRRFAWYFGAHDRVILYILFASLVVFMFAGVLGFGNATGPAGRLIYRFAAIVMDLLLYLFLFVIVTDLLRIFIKARPETWGMTVLVLTLAVFVYGVWNASRVRLKEMTLPVRDLTHEVRIAHLSDLHLGHFRGESFLRDILKRISDKNVDAVLITGDLFDGRKQVNDEVTGLFREVDVPVFFVEGNHDLYTGVRTIKEKLRAAGVHVLEDEVVPFEGMQIVGLDYLGRDRRGPGAAAHPGRRDMLAVLNRLNLDRRKPVLLLHHSPVYVDQAWEAGVDLYLAGHTHGGQLFPLTVIAGMVHTYNKGLHDHRGMWVYVSQGAGTFGPPLRVGTHSEMAVITLVPADGTVSPDKKK